MSSVTQTNRRMHTEEDTVIQEIVKNGGFSTFWAHENSYRAAAILRLAQRGDITQTGEKFPFISYTLRKRLT